MDKGRNPCILCLAAWYQAWDLDEGKITRTPK
jgi:hypothetical protein